MSLASLPSRCLVRLVMGCALLGCSASSQGASDWRALAEQALRQALTKQHPNIEEWRLRALTGARQEPRLAAQPVVDAEVMQLGARSAVQLWCDQQSRYRCATVWFAVSGLQYAVTSAAELAQAGTVRAQGLIMQQHDVMKLGCEPLSSLEGVEGSRTRQRLYAGQALCRNFLEPRPAVGRGESVTVRAVAGSVAITAHAVAQQDGNVGQTVRIKRSNSISPFMATVTGVGQVTVNENGR
jgi:flagella basal body P-ring formation protein FlgA